MASPSQYKRPTGPEVVYQAQVSAQNSARQKVIEAEQEKQKIKSLTQRLTDAKTWETKTLAQKVAAEKELAANKQVLSTMKLNAHLPGSPGGYEITEAEQNEMNQYGSLYIAPLTTQLTVLNKQYNDAVAARKSLEKQLGTGQQQQQKDTLNKNIAANNTSKKDGKVIKESAGYSPIKYVYNAPMINWAYLNSNGPQQGTKIFGSDGVMNSNSSTMLVRPIGAPSASDNGEALWMNKAYSSKGVIQMNVNFNSAVMSGLTTGSKYDDQLYGFRFLYNPKEVAMTWGLAEGVNWEAVQTGLDKSTPISTGLLNSTISFSLLLNRMGDMQYLNEDGLIPEVKNPYPSFNRSKGKTLNKELSEIYKRGTMYDLEYLFKTIMGINSTYKSGLNGETADKGWLQGIPVDLHLGDGLRYQVRIGSLDVNHSIFNDRMVPILSTVNITCHRFYDLAQTPSNTSAAARGGGRGALLD